MEIQFLGAAREVTGSCFLIQTHQHRILVDCGLIQGSRKQAARNFKPFPFDPETIDALILTHAHIDHSGKIPVLIKAGFKGKIYTHPATIDLCHIMLQDGGFLNEKDTELENRKRARRGQPPLTPLYTVQEAQKAMTFFSPLTYDHKCEILPQATLKLSDAGHLLGSAIIELWLTEKGVTRKLVFSGDLGRKNMPLLRDPTPIQNADLVVMESTYGDRFLPDWNSALEEFSKVIIQARQSKGNILIPSFAVGRSQEILYAFHEHFKALSLEKALIFLDSPMAIEVTKVYAKHWPLYDKEAKRVVQRTGSPYHLPNLRLSLSTQESMAINQVRQGAIIIACSGMLDGGRIRHHLKHNLWRKQCHLIFVGYQAQGTLGRRILEGAKEIKLWSELIQVNAKIHMISGFSAHADQTGLCQWYHQFSQRPPVALVHGELNGLHGLASTLHEQFGIKPWIPKYRDRYDLIHHVPLP